MRAFRAVVVFACLAACLAVPPRAHAQGAGSFYPDSLAELRAAAEQGDADSQVLMGRLYFEGEGVPQDDAEALRWWRLAAAQNNRDAQFRISYMYEYGRGVPLDLDEAIHWYRLGAAQGDELAQFNLGRMYYTGQGVPQDFAEAARWWRMAARLHNLVAQFNLGVMYETGRGVTQDDVRAYMWFSLSTAASSDEDWVRRLAYRDAVGARLTADQRARAETLASACRASAFLDCGD
ncbi:MAG: tetratricopeptide repeat protein [Vicinamibacterales bacterium]